MKILNKMKFFIALLLIVLMQLVFIPSETYAVTPPDRGLGAADSYGVFGAAGVTNDGAPTHIWGDVGANSSVTGLDDTTQVDGTIKVAPATNGVATDASSTYDSLMSDLQGTSTPLDLAGTHTITPGIYDIAASTLNGALTLNGAGVYIFRSSSSNTTAVSGTMNLINGACASNVFWAISTSMTINTGAHVEGTIIASTGSITFGTGATLVGRAISLTQIVTLLSNQITQPICAAITPTPTSALTPTPTPTASSSSTPSPTPTSTPISNSFSGSSTSTPVCIDTPPTNNPDFFQIDRAGSTAVLHFTPVSNNLSYYYVAYGLSPESEEYGVSFPAGLSTGAVTYTINDLNPNLTYYFKVRGGNGCAPGGWSNNRESNSKNPGLPNTGFAPRENNIPWAEISIQELKKIITNVWSYLPILYTSFIALDKSTTTSYIMYSN